MKFPMGFPSFRIAPSAPELPAAWRGAHSDTPDTFEHSIVALHHRYTTRLECQDRQWARREAMARGTPRPQRRRPGAAGAP